ncbi:class I SAM-dependent methyltransferase [Lysobacter sp. BMK333-48F3]|uniref:class I SAM-dependent methyltransferase n=1 Tax=Lysobacter sp. BMK333-48F3 TaxID=2867962 RepID=UPI001C8BF04E|nr:class I SAM-dependent methyltransferase [Lysobacter sp. BMK333-48F3]MBX9400068.1 class I SAM-dependent methyltransferase [Lysobacter sp. BMK333-48F3]
MSTNPFKDHFSALARSYAASRPEYPDALFDAIGAHLPAGPVRVWEPGCGSGQATRGLAARYQRVHATEPSAAQIERHWAREAALRGEGKVELAIEPAERCSLDDASVELVAVAQAMHWFERERFFAECERVLVPGGVLAVWAYGDFLAPEGMVEAVEAFRARIDPYWQPENAEVRDRYAGYAWPFAALPAPELWLEAEWSLGRWLGYLHSLSAVERCRAATGDDPVALHRTALSAAWGAAEDLRTIQWPLHLHLRRKPG